MHQQRAACQSMDGLQRMGRQHCVTNAGHMLDACSTSTRHIFWRWWVVFERLPLNFLALGCSKCLAKVCNLLRQARGESVFLSSSH
jgi:hypothetical protein